MKNPFLEDRKPFGSFKPSSSSNPSTNSNRLPQNNIDISASKQSNLPQTYGNSYQTRIDADERGYNVNEKLTFGDPKSSSANYHTTDLYSKPQPQTNNQRTSGYFNVRNSLSTDGIDPSPSYKYSNYSKRDENDGFPKAKENNFFMRQSNQISNKPQPHYYDKHSEKGLNEFAPPPINNFHGDYPKKQSNYSYHSSKFNQNRHRNQRQEFGRNLGRHDDYDRNGDQQYHQFNTASIDGSAYKKNDLKGSPTNTRSINTANNYFQSSKNYELSPIGEVSKHRINEESLMNLEGLENGQDLDRLLADSKTQDQLIKILGIEAPVKKSLQASDEKHYGLPQDNFLSKANGYEKSTHANHATSNFLNEPHQNRQGRNSGHENSDPYRKRQSGNTYQTSESAIQPFDVEMAMGKQPEVMDYHSNSRREQTYNPYHNNKQLTEQMLGSFGGNRVQQNSDLAPQQRDEKMPTFKRNDRRSDTYPISNSRQAHPEKHTDQQAHQAEQLDISEKLSKEMLKLCSTYNSSGQQKRLFITTNEKISTIRYDLKQL